MGCTEVKSFENKDEAFSAISRNPARLPISTQKESYRHNHESFSLLLLNKSISDSFNDAEIENEEKFDNFITSIHSKYFADFSQYKLTEEALKSTFLEQILEFDMEDRLEYKSFSVQNTLTEILENNEDYINKDNLSQKFAITSRRYFKENQKMITLKQLSNVDMKHIFSNLKFNSKFQYDAIKIVLSEGIMNTTQYLLNIAEIILCKPKLTSVFLLFQALKPNDYDVWKGGRLTIDQEKLNQMHYIFDTITLNNNISVLALCCYEDYDISLPPIARESFIKLLKKDYLFSLVILKMNFSQQEIIEIIRTISSLVNIKFLVLDLKNFTTETVNYLIDAVIKNKRILSCIVSGGSLGINSQEKDLLIKKYNVNFKCFVYTKQLNIFVD